MTQEELAEKITDLVMMLAEENRWPVQKYQMNSVIAQALKSQETDNISKGISDWQSYVDSKIHELIKDWEEKMPEDTTLYSLGLRHSLDIIRGKNVETG